MIDSDEFLDPSAGLSMEDRLLPSTATLSDSGSSRVGAKSCEARLDEDVCLRIGGGGGFVIGRTGSAGEAVGEGVLALSSLL